MAFDFLSSAAGPVTTGPAGGVITLDLAEADPVHREQARSELDEPYRTVLGHLRHQLGHDYQPILARSQAIVDRSAGTTRRRCDDQGDL